MKLIALHNLSQKRYNALKKEGISTPSDLLHFFPRRYIDKSTILPIKNLYQSDGPVTIVGRVLSKQVTGYKHKKRLEVLVQDHTASLKVVYFKGWKYFINQFKEDQWVMLYGTAKQFGHSFSMAHPEVDKLKSPNQTEHAATLIPVYPSNQHFSKTHITNKLISQWVNTLLSSVHMDEFLPEEIIKTYNFPHRINALKKIHQPETVNDTKIALDRFKFEELFLFELSMARFKNKRIQKSTSVKLTPGPLTKAFFNDLLPFSLTEGQKTSLSDIRADLKSGKQMNRLIQGDVGAGKTVVAIGAMLMAIDSGYQAAFMAPTEILAEQHFHTIKKFLEPLGINYRLITGGMPTRLRRDILTDIEGGNCNIAIGTHAIFQESVNFHNLALAVIDEQHRFGVKQRNEMLQKGNNPHLLVMSATPIPRSLAMTIYSDLDISVIKQLPSGRKPIKTAVRMDQNRDDVYNFVQQRIEADEQIYIVFPLIEESEAMDLKDATRGFEKLKKRFPSVRIELLHGRLSSEEKEHIMQRFSEGNVDILVSTTVIEVGVDVPNATIMMIEHAERFGLSQLHQLRGRIGRGEKQSYCILMPGSKLSKDGRYRLQKLVETNDGFEIAEADLKLRGPGDFLGTKQSGLPDFTFADILEDRLILEQAKNEAWDIIRKDPELETSSHQSLKKVFDPYFKKRAEFYEVG